MGPICWTPSPVQSFQADSGHTPTCTLPSQAPQHNRDYCCAILGYDVPGPSTGPGTALAPVERLRLQSLAAAFLLGYEGATRAAYGRDLRHWFDWCAAHDLDPLAAQRAHVDAYARTLAEVDGRSSRHRGPPPLHHLGLLPVRRRRGRRRPQPSGQCPAAKGGVRHRVHGPLPRRAGRPHSPQPADSPRSLALVLLLGLNGLRVSEALGADVEDLTTERGHRVLRIKRKGGKTATVPLAPRTAEAVDAYVGDRTTGPLFVTATGDALAPVRGVADPETAGEGGRPGESGQPPSS